MIIGNIALLGAVLFFALIPMVVALVKFRSAEQEFADYKSWNEEQHSKIERDIRYTELDAAKKLRTARRLHERTRLMLEEMRRLKTRS